MQTSEGSACRVTNEALIEAVEHLRDVMSDVATGGSRIPSVNDGFRREYGVVAAELSRRGIMNTIPFGDLWDWYARWSDGSLQTYESRRCFLSSLFEPLLVRLRTGELTPVELTGWPRVDRTVEQIRARLTTAETEEQFQTVGLLCREVVISLAQVVYDPSKHAPIDGVRPSETDARRLLESFLASELAGGPNAEARAHAKSALALAVALQHRRTAGFRDAALCAEATLAVTNIAAIVSGRRDPR